MKIALVNSYRYYETGEEPIVSGMVVYNRGLARALALRGHEVTVLGGGFSSNFLRTYEFEGTTVHQIPFDGNNMVFARSVHDFLSANPHDVVESHNWSSPLILEQLIGGTPTVVRFASDMLSLAEVGRIHDASRQVMMSDYLLEENTIHRSDAVLAAGQKMVVRAARLGVQAEEVPLGISDVDCGNTERAGILIMIARFDEPRKGGEFTASIIQQIPGMIPITVVGSLDGEDARHELVESIGKRKGEVNWIFDAIPTSDLEELYRGALATVVPTKSESFGLVLLEPMAFGCPVISFHQDDPSKKDWPLYRMGPVATESLSSIPKILTEISEDAAASDTARGHARKFLWKNLVSQYEAVYEKAIVHGLLSGRKRGW